MQTASTDGHWQEYELIDTGGFEKLERFGPYILRRPEPQAIWPKKLSEKEWSSLPEASFVKTSGNKNSRTDHLSENNERGEWLLKPGMPGQWFVNYKYKNLYLRFRLGMTAFKHVGLFPEQASNWNFIYESLLQEQTRHEQLPELQEQKQYDQQQQQQGPQPGQQQQQSSVLNLFAYTGGASLAAKACGADVSHLDSVKQVLSWARENMEASGLDNIRWIVEDALKYVRREARRGKKYQGIILDPPAYGRGPEGEKWILEEGIVPLMEACRELLDPKRAFLVLNLYSMGFSASVARNLLGEYFPYVQHIESGELAINDQAGRSLPLSVYARFSHTEL